ncbi:MAG: hypothetical protein R2741_01185 [Methanolobus sp.]
MPHDIIQYKDRVIEIGNSEKMLQALILKAVHVLQLLLMTWKAQYLSQKKDLRKTMLVAIENDDLLSLILILIETVTIKKPVIFSAETGSEIPVVKTENGLLAVSDL